MSNPKRIKKETSDLIYHAVKFRNLPEIDCIAITVFLSKYLEVKL